MGKPKSPSTHSFKSQTFKKPPKKLDKDICNQTIIDKETAGNSIDADDNETMEMCKLMGFSSFKSSKGVPKPGNNLVGAKDVQNFRGYTQYMHRKTPFYTGSGEDNNKKETEST